MKDFRRENNLNNASAIPRQEDIPQSAQRSPIKRNSSPTRFNHLQDTVSTTFMPKMMTSALYRESTPLDLYSYLKSFYSRMSINKNQTMTQIAEPAKTTTIQDIETRQHTDHYQSSNRHQSVLSNSNYPRSLPRLNYISNRRSSVELLPNTST